MSLPLSEYVKMIPTTRTVSPPGYPNHQRLVLTEVVQQLMRRVLNLMPDSQTQTNNKCLSWLNAGNVWVDVESGIPFLHAVIWRKYDDNLAQMNYARVEEIFRQTIFSGAVASLPPDFQQLLHLMRTKGHTACYIIQHHCSLVWAVDKKEFFLRVYDYSNDLLRKSKYRCYAHVMNNLDFPTDWDIQIGQNQYLDMFYRRSNYHPVGPNAGKEVLRFKRNTYSHSLQHAWDMRTRQQIYDQAQLVQMMETVLPLVLHSFQVALDDLGLLRDRRLILKTFFQ